MDLLTLLSVLHQLPDHDGVHVKAQDDGPVAGTTSGPREFCCPACALRWVNTTGAARAGMVVSVHSIKHMPRVPEGFPCWLKIQCTKSTSSR